MDSQVNFTQVENSLGRCINHGDLFGCFYQNLVNSHPAIRHGLFGMEASKRKDALRNTINLAIMYAEENPIGKNGIGRICSSHSQGKIGFHAGLAHHWLDSFIASLREVDPDFDVGLETQWRAILKPCLDRLHDGAS
jgi:hemoglobin-like flavoprotein